MNGDSLERIEKLARAESISRCDPEDSVRDGYFGPTGMEERATGDWVRWDDVREHVEAVPALAARARRMDVHLHTWRHIALSAIGACRALVRGDPGSAVDLAEWALSMFEDHESEEP